MHIAHSSGTNFLGPLMLSIELVVFPMRLVIQGDTCNGSVGHEDVDDGCRDGVDVGDGDVGDASDAGGDVGVCDAGGDVGDGDVCDAGGDVGDAVGDGDVGDTGGDVGGVW